MNNAIAVISAMVPFLNPETHYQHKHKLNQKAKQRNAVKFSTSALT